MQAMHTLRSTAWHNAAQRSNTAQARTEKNIPGQIRTGQKRTEQRKSRPVQHRTAQRRPGQNETAQRNARPRAGARTACEASRPLASRRHPSSYSRACAPSNDLSARARPRNCSVWLLDFWLLRMVWNTRVLTWGRWAGGLVGQSAGWSVGCLVVAGLGDWLVMSLVAWEQLVQWAPWEGGYKRRAVKPLQSLEGRPHGVDGGVQDSWKRVLAWQIRLRVQEGLAGVLGGLGVGGWCASGKRSSQCQWEKKQPVPPLPVGKEAATASGKRSSARGVTVGLKA
eukprot:353161-Chlamydomonas_euryale.AAC.5